MTDCQFDLDRGLWTCPLCGWTYPRPTKKPPRRNCPAADLAAAADRQLAKIRPCPKQKDPP